MSNNQSINCRQLVVMIAGEVRQLRGEVRKGLARTIVGQIDLSGHMVGRWGQMLG
jgi:hypothetical protein